jgi:hypothetical protein
MSDMLAATAGVLLLLGVIALLVAAAVSDHRFRARHVLRMAELEPLATILRGTVRARR